MKIQFHRWWRWGVVLLAVTAGAWAQTPDAIAILKFDSAEQTGPNSFAADPFIIYVRISFPAPLSYLNTVQLVWPDGGLSSVPRTDDMTYEGWLTYTSAAERDADFPPGQYYIRINYVYAGQIPVMFNPGMAAALKVTNWADLQPFRQLPLTIQWSPITGAGPDDFLDLEVDTDDDVIFDVDSDGSLPLDRTSYSWSGAVPGNVPLHGMLSYLRGNYATAPNGITKIGTGAGAYLYFDLRYDPTPPAIVNQPVVQAVGAGRTAIFSVGINLSTAQYQWYRDGSAIPGATNASYTVTSAQVSDAGIYTVRVSTGNGTVTSAPAQLTIAPALNITTWFAMGSGLVVTDGAPGVGRFAGLNGAVAGEGGVFYVADDYAVRVIAADGTLSTLAGNAAQSGYVDGGATVARFGQLRGIARGPDGSLYVADRGNGRIRRVTLEGEVSTVQQRISPDVEEAAKFPTVQDVKVSSSGEIFVLTERTLSVITPTGDVQLIAGDTNSIASRDGTGTGAAFQSPSTFACVSLSGADGFYVVEGTKLRKVSRDGVVTTFFAPGGGSAGSLEGAPGSVGVRTITGIATDGSGAAYILDYSSIRRVTPSGWTNVMAGQDVAVEKDGLGAKAGLHHPEALAITADGTFCFFDRPNFPSTPWVVRRGSLQAGEPQLVVNEPAPNLAVTDASTVVWKAPVVAPWTDYQWLHEGVVLGGATKETLLLTNLQPADAGAYRVRITTPAGSAVWTAGVLTVLADALPSRIMNLSIRTNAGTGDKTLIVGFVVSGASGGNLPLLIRGNGPALSAFGLTSYLRDPGLVLFKGGTQLAANDDWGGAAEIVNTAARVGAFAIFPNTSRDAALLKSVDPLPHTVQVRGMDGGTGVALVEVYDAVDGTIATATPRLVNVSARAEVQTGSGVLIAGFVVSGETSKTMLIRGVGPTLTNYGVMGALANPKLTLYRESTAIADNDDWGGDTQVKAVMAQVGAFDFTSATSKDAALLITLPPGVYSAQVRGVGDTTGVALAEVYEVP